MSSSLEQVSANRENALKSTGPKTKEGREVAKMNAVKHGFFSQAVVVRGGRVRESRRGFTELHRQFVEELKPSGVVEEMLVDQVVSAAWRLRRVWAAESGEVALSVEKEGRTGEMPPIAQLKYWLEGTVDPVWTMQRWCSGNRLLGNWLRRLRLEVEREHGLTKEAVAELERSFDDRPNLWTADLRELEKQWRDPQGEQDEATWREERRKRALAWVDERLSTVERQAQVCRTEENVMEQARRSAAVLPSAAVLEKITRYEMRLQKQLYKALKRLDEVQRRRNLNSKEREEAHREDLK